MPCPFPWSRRHMYSEARTIWVLERLMSLPDNPVGHVTWEIHVGCVKKLKIWSYCGRTLPILTDTRSPQVWNCNEYTQLWLCCSVLLPNQYGSPKSSQVKTTAMIIYSKSFLTFTVITSAILKEVNRLILGAVIATVMQLQKGGKEGQWHRCRAVLAYGRTELLPKGSMVPLSQNNRTLAHCLEMTKQTSFLRQGYNKNAKAAKSDCSSGFLFDSFATKFFSSAGPQMGTMMLSSRYGIWRFMTITNRSV